MALPLSRILWLLACPFTAKGRAFLLQRTHRSHGRFYFRLAWLYRRTLARSPCVVAVVGSFGKTTTVRAILIGLGIPEGRTAANLNSQGYIAYAFFSTPRNRSHVVVEAGIDRPRLMRRNLRALRPNVVVVTTIGDEHIYSFRDRDHLRDEKAESVRVLRAQDIAVLNWDDPNVRWMATQTKARVVWYGFAESCHYRGLEWDLNWPNQSKLTYQTPTQRGVLVTALICQESAYAALAALAVAEETSQAAVARNLAGLNPTPGRLQRLYAPQGFWIIRDEFKSSIETIRLALAVIDTYPGRKIVVLGGISAAPKPPGPTYREIGRLLAHVADEVILVLGDWSDKYSPEIRRQIKAGCRLTHLHHTKTITATAELVRQRAQPGDIVLVKGRTEECLGRIADALMTAPILVPNA